MMSWVIGVLTLCGCFSLGSRVLVLLKVPVKKDETVVFGTALGLVALAYAVLFLGLCGILFPPMLWALLAGLAVLAAADFRANVRALGSGFSEWKIPATLPNLTMFLLSAVPVLSALLGTLAPEIANDSLCYHLHLPKLFLKHRQVGMMPYEVNSLFPFLMEMLYTLGLGTGGVTLAKFFHFSTGLLAAGAVLMYLRRYVKVEVAWFSALLFLTTPGIANQLDTTYVDAAFTCFSLLVLIPVLHWTETRGRGWIVLAGIFAGAVLSVKYLGLIPVLILCSMIAWTSFKDNRDLKGALKAVLFFLGPAFAVSAYWYVRSWIELGNPVYPYFYQIFKSGDPAMTYDDIGVKKTLLNFLAIPWTITMHPEKFEGFGVQFGPAYLAFLPAILFNLKKIPCWRRLCGFCFFYLLIWFFLGQDLRFLYPILPVLAILMGFGLAKVDWKGAIRKSVAVLAGFVLLLNALLAIYHFRNIYPVALGLRTPESYLGRMERSYRISRQVNQSLPEGSRILVEESHLFYFDRPIVREVSYAQFTEYFKAAKSAEDVFMRLAGDGFTHILTSEENEAVPLDAGEPLRVPNLVGEALEKKMIRKVYSFYPKEFTGGSILYTLYEIETGKK